jgi:hypothetical protein
MSQIDSSVARGKRVYSLEIHAEGVGLTHTGDDGIEIDAGREIPKDAVKCLRFDVWNFMAEVVGQRSIFELTCLLLRIRPAKVVLGSGSLP